jgi:hypothetical protein
MIDTGDCEYTAAAVIAVATRREGINGSDFVDGRDSTDTELTQQCST